MVNLDGQEVYGRTDSKGMGDFIERFPAQVEEAWRIGNDFRAPSEYAAADNVVIQGMGGSAIGGDLLRALYVNELKVPAVVVRDYSLPAFAGPRTLYIASSYSGDTEETLAGYVAAKHAGCKILCMTGGGRLAELASQDRIPLITIPVAQDMQPRAALGYSFFPLLAALGRLRYIGPADAEVEETLAVLRSGVERLGRPAPVALNPAKGLAQWLHGHCPVIYAAGIWPAIVAMRWKGQFNENAKNLAFWNAFPELNHNELVGYEAPPDLVKKVRVIVLRTGEESPMVAKRIEVTSGIIRKAGAGVREVKAEGASDLCRMFSLIQMGDFVSYYLAILNGVDPTPVRVIDLLKTELAGVRE